MFGIKNWPLMTNLDQVNSLTVKSAAHDVDIGKPPDEKIKGTWGASHVLYDT